MIVGRSGSGKDTLAGFLIEKFNMRQLLSYTTRPKRTPDEATHIFITEDEASSFTDRIAETVVDGYQYFATKEQLESCDNYVIDPRGLEEVCKKAPETDICVVYINASKEVRKQRAKKRAASPKMASVIFESRNSDEDEMFKEFEEMVYAKDMTAFKNRFPTAMTLITMDNETGTKKAMSKKAELVELYASQLSLGDMFTPHVHRI